jgi:hypothetical protein
VKRLSLALLGVLALTAMAAWIAGIGSVTRSRPPFLVKVSSPKADCLEGTYLPSRVSGWEVNEDGVPQDWSRIENAPGAMQSGRAAVEVTISPKQAGEEITLRGIEFDVTKIETRPLGITFYRPCRRRVRGAAIEASLDLDPHVVASNAALDGVLLPGPHLPAHKKPIRFPWTLELDRPLHLYVVVHSESTFCAWSARIPWQSGSSQGVIRVDDGGRRYRLNHMLVTWWQRPGPGGEWWRTSSPRWVS